MSDENYVLPVKNFNIFIQITYPDHIKEVI
ncbi:hypothetical protein D2E25_2015 [Bifidobacterium goeldii]|uniref:Uncharacterized protein n=1 Tax=Bifidobacterium goeldii TaxID=2306975 RepID=A0A430FCL6_9BIFI|nr:hypothetical protein D2E25_2015 [Bifidobacterium goeldii]